MCLRGDAWRMAAYLMRNARASLQTSFLRYATRRHIGMLASCVRAEQHQEAGEHLPSLFLSFSSSLTSATQLWHISWDRLSTKQETVVCVPTPLASFFHCSLISSSSVVKRLFSGTASLQTHQESWCEIPLCWI